MNKKGFSLVELLLVIVIIAIITLLVLPNMTDILNTGKNKKWTTIEDILKTNLELYNIDYLEDLWCEPTVLEDGTEITCNNVITEYSPSIDEVLEVNPDINMENCEATHLKIKKNSSNFTYEVCIKCGDEYKSEYDYCPN